MDLCNNIAKYSIFGNIAEYSSITHKQLRTIFVQNRWMAGVSPIYNGKLRQSIISTATSESVLCTQPYMAECGITLSIQCQMYRNKIL